MSAAPAFQVRAVPGLPEVDEGDDLAKLIAAAAPTLADGDIVLVTSKIVSKAEGRVLAADSREAAIDAETVRVVARRGALRIVENRQGLVMAAAGVDASNTPAGTVLLLPEDPDASARALRAGPPALRPWFSSPSRSAIAGIVFSPSCVQLVQAGWSNPPVVLGSFHDDPGEYRPGQGHTVRARRHGRSR